MLHPFGPRLSRADMQRAAVLSLTGKREVDEDPSL